MTHNDVRGQKMARNTVMYIIQLHSMFCYKILWYSVATLETKHFICGYSNL